MQIGRDLPLGVLAGEQVRVPEVDPRLRGETAPGDPFRVRARRELTEHEQLVQAGRTPPVGPGRGRVECGDEPIGRHGVRRAARETPVPVAPVGPQPALGEVRNRRRGRLLRFPGQRLPIRLDVVQEVLPVRAQMGEQPVRAGREREGGGGQTAQFLGDGEGVAVQPVIRLFVGGDPRHPGGDHAGDRQGGFGEIVVLFLEPQELGEQAGHRGRDVVALLDLRHRVGGLVAVERTLQEADLVVHGGDPAMIAHTVR